jgi:hypothetical protein
MTVTKKRLFGPALLSNAAATKYTVPPATRTTIRRILIDNPSGGIVTCTITIGADAAGTRILGAVPIPANGGLDLYGPFTLETGEILQAYAGSANVLVLLVNGEEET